MEEAIGAVESGDLGAAEVESLLAEFSLFGAFVSAFAGMGFVVGCLCKCWVRRLFRDWKAAAGMQRSIDDLPRSKEERAEVQRRFRATWR